MAGPAAAGGGGRGRRMGRDRDYSAAGFRVQKSITNTSSM